MLTPVADAWEDWGPEQDVNTKAVMNEVLETESQQLVVLNGDIITGENTYLKNSTHYVDQVVEPLLVRDLTWASTYGNHDGQYNLNGKDLLLREQQWPNARTKNMIPGQGIGDTNYYLPVYSSKCTPSYYGNCTPMLLLWFFDSRGGFEFQRLDASGDYVGRPNWVDAQVVDWFRNTSVSLAHQYNRSIPSLAFVNQPVHASKEFQAQKEVDPNREPGINDDKPLAGQADGWCADGTQSESCDYGGQDEPFMDALASTPGLIAVFSGHDHGDTWCHKWNPNANHIAASGSGINLCFGQHTGYGGYGSWIRGSRQVLLTEAMLENLEAETWIRVEDRSVVGHVSLNSTYGQDSYPATPNKHT